VNTGLGSIAPVSSFENELRKGIRSYVVREVDIRGSRARWFSSLYWVSLRYKVLGFVLDVDSNGTDHKH
jgi:hypothetical protein